MKKMIRVILNANVILSALIYKGKLKKLLDYVSKECVICLSSSLISEVNDKLKNRFNADTRIFHNFGDFARFTEVFSPDVKIDFPKDPDDAYLLELIEICEADYLITGDKKHLLPLKKWKNTKIISPKDFLKDLAPLA